MWEARSENLADSSGMRFTVNINSGPASVTDVLRGWRADAGFRTLFNSLLAASPYEAFRWETPAVTVSTLTRPFEFVVLDRPGLSREPDLDAFREYFGVASDGIATFSNLGGDAIMIVPCPLGNPTAYGHLAAFVRRAPEPQRNALWRRVGEAMEQRIGTKPVWLSTAGAGVSWLHVRLDDWPKYYGFGPYRKSA